MTIKNIKATLDAYLEGTKVKEKEITEALDALGSKYADEKYPFEVVEIAGGFQFMTKGAFFPLISQFLKIESKKKLSRAALETLSIISYKQPITKSSMESIRGVNCDYAVQKLLEKELVEITGRAEGPGRPLLYGTSEKFMNHFGLKNLNELPKVKEFELPENTVGVQTDDQPAPQLAAKSDENEDNEEAVIEEDQPQSNEETVNVEGQNEELIDDEQHLEEGVVVEVLDNDVEVSDQEDNTEVITEDVIVEETIDPKQLTSKEEEE